MMQRAMSAHVNYLKAYGGTPCTYRGVDGLSLVLTMAPAMRNTEAQTEDNVVVDKQMHDWLCNVSDLPRKPLRGDIINNNTEYYRVVQPGGGREYDYMDPWGFAYRIHTILVDGDLGSPPPIIIPPPINPPVTIRGYAPSGNEGVDTYGSPDGTTYGPP